MTVMVTGNAAVKGRKVRHAAALSLGAATLLLAASTALAQSRPETNRTTSTSSASSSATTMATAPLRPATTLPRATSTSDTDAETADPAVADPTVTSGVPAPDEQLLEIDDREDLGRTNLRGTRVDEQPTRRRTEESETPGVSVGTFTLRPSLSQTVNTEESRSGGTRERRSYAETGVKGVLTSDWSRHQLTITGEGLWQKNLSGDGATKPSASLDAELRLDLSGDTTATLSAGYNFSREDTDDPNAISGASQQSGIHNFSGGLALERDLGILRGLVGLDGERWSYSDVRLNDGTVVSLKDRDRIAGTLRGRLGYEISPALIPFLEASIGRVEYDRARDVAGYARSADVYGGKAGVTVDLGEKLRGEMGLGYRRQVFEDSRLADLEAVAVEGSLNWSPLRGTDINFNASTALEPSTTAGENGYVSRTLAAALTHQLRDELVARLTGTVRWNDYSGAADANDYTVYTTGAGLSYALNRYVDLTADLGYEHTQRKTAASTQVLRAGIGITAKR